MKTRLIIVPVGLSLSGKDTVANYLVGRGFYHISLSDILRDICRQRKSYHGRDDLIRIGNELRQRYGAGYLARKALDRAKKYSTDKLVVSSARNPQEVLELKKGGVVFLIEVKAPQKVRYQRALKRKKIDDLVSFARFFKQESLERRGSAHQQQLDKVMAMADYAVLNNGTIRDLYKKINRILTNIIDKMTTKKTYTMIILGPQGSGKGTQAKVLAQKFNLYHVETGKIFRKIAKQKTLLGRKVDQLMNKKGRLIPFPLVAVILGRELAKIDKNRGLVFDGYPRNLVQARYLDGILKRLGRKITHVFYLPISKKTTVRRLALRRTCRKCGRIFILGADLKSHQTMCPACGCPIIQRADDKPAAIAKRLEIFQRQTRPLTEYYRKKGLLIKINGEPPIPQVTKEVMRYFTRLRRKPRVLTRG